MLPNTFITANGIKNTMKEESKKILQSEYMFQDMMLHVLHQEMDAELHNTPPGEWMGEE